MPYHYYYVNNYIDIYFCFPATYVCAASQMFYYVNSYYINTRITLTRCFFFLLKCNDAFRTRRRISTLFTVGNIRLTYCNIWIYMVIFVVCAIWLLYNILNYYHYVKYLNYQLMLILTLILSLLLNILPHILYREIATGIASTIEYLGMIHLSQHILRCISYTLSRHYTLDSL